MTVRSARRPVEPAVRQPAWGRLTAFVAVAYALSWAWVIPFAAKGRRVYDGQGWPTHLPALAGPLVAALTVAFVSGGRRELAVLGRRLNRWRVGPRWWAVAASPLLVAAAVVLVLEPVGAAPPLADFGRFSGVSDGLGVVGVWLVVIAVNGLGEETGWRGYALPLLQQRFTPLTATVIVSVIWAGWHLPQFFYVDSFAGFSPVMIPIWVYGLFCGAVVMTWIFNHTRSVLAVAVFHGLYNVTGATAAASDHSGLLSVVMWSYVVALATFLLRAERRANARGSSVLGTSAPR